MDGKIISGHRTDNTQPRGNTRARGWQLTLNEVDKYDAVLERLNKYKSLKYLISCKEKAPTTDHEHIHIYVNFSNPVCLKYKEYFGAHLERCRGTPKQNIAYIEKDGNILDEIGERPHQGALSVNDLMAIEDKKDLPDARLYRVWKEIKQDDDLIFTVDTYRKRHGMEVVWIKGDSGTGKTQKALEMLEGDKFVDVKFDGNFWNGCNQMTNKIANACLYDDFRDNHMKASEFINFIDYNIHNMNIKGGSCKNYFRKIIITSIQDPEEIYANVSEESRVQWLRRIKVIDISPVLQE